MVTHLPQNQFITNSTAIQPPAVDTAVVSKPPADATAVLISVSEGVLCTSLPSVEMEPLATVALAPSGTAVTDSAAAGPVTVETIPEPSMTMEVPQRAPAGHAPNTAAPAGLSHNPVTQAVEIAGADELARLIGVAGKRSRRRLALPRFVPDEDAIERAMHDENAPRLRAGDPVWADESPLFLQRSA